MSDIDAMLARRDALLGPGMSTFYRRPLHIVRGEGVWLWDADGRRYLDAYNNVPHVGHCHPAVVEAICRQASTLNTHTRYLHAGILDYVERLTATFAAPLRSAILTCTGSEANDIALRMAQAVTGRTGVIATDFTYHGNTAAVAHLSTRMPPIGGTGGHVRHVPAPDGLRPLGGTGGAAFTAAWAAAVEAAIADLAASPHGFSALVICPFFANEGFPTLPEGFLAPAAEAVRKAGGLLICDEVQPGFGRLGRHFWGHQRAAVQPDIVTMGKPMGNGHPVAAVVTSPEIIGAFRGAFRYFNTFGGNPVSVAAASAVLDVLEAERLPEKAETTGAVVRAAFERIAARHPRIAQVRGAGLFFGAEFVRPDGSPDGDFTAEVVEGMLARGVILNRLGRGMNTLKIRPPLVFGAAEADLLAGALADTLAELDR
ncbi:MAG: aspartate aminotransferase family protein [Gemmobacter sp.]